MKSILGWALDRRYWVIILAVVFVQVFPPITTALLLVDTTRHGPPRGIADAAIGMIVVVILGLAAGGGLTATLLVAVLSMFAGVALGTVLHRTGSLALAFQGTMLGVLLLGAVLSFVGPSAATVIEPIVTELVSLMEASGASSEQIAVFRGWDPVMLVGLLIGGLGLQFLGALMLGAWWNSRLSESGAFAQAFRQLKLGRIVSITSMVALALSVVVDWQVVEYVTPLAVVGFLFQGLAVLHAWSHAKKWHPLAVGIVYLSLITPISGVTVLGLSAAGLLDNFFALRAPLGGPS